MGHSKDDPLEALFAAAHPLALRAARVRSGRLVNALRAAALDPSDLEQEIMLALVSALIDFDESRSSLATFVDRIAESKAMSVLRKTAAKKRSQKALPIREPLLIFVALDRRLDLDRALRKVSQKDRRVALLLADSNTTEVARLLTTSRANVYRSIARLREVLTEAGF